MLASFGLLFLPEVALQSLALTAFRDSNRPYIGGALLVSISLLVGQLLISSAASLREIFKKLAAHREQIEAARKRTEILHKLTPDEKAYLAPYILDEKNTQYFGIQDGIAGGLQAKEIIYRASFAGISGFAFNIQPWARDYLTANLQLLESANVQKKIELPW